MPQGVDAALPDLSGADPHADEAVRDSRITLPAGTAVWTSIYLAHRRPDVWDDPSAFRPERFLDGSGGAPNQFFPFGGGARRCLGALFAEFEMRIVLAEVLHRFDMEPAAKPPRAIFAGLSLSPEDGVPVRARPRA